MVLSLPRARRPFLYSASEAPRIDLCTGGLWLPQAPEVFAETSHGTLVHHFLHRAKQIGKAEALLEQAEFFGWTGTYDEDGEPLYEEADRQTEELLDTLEAIPVERIPEGLEPEVSFAYNLRTGEVRLLGTGLGRRYERDGALGPDWVVGTADLAGQRDEHLVIPDYKTGVMRQRARFSRQLSTLAVLASKATGLRRASVSNLYIGRKGRLCPDAAELGPADLDEQEERMRAVPGRLATAEAMLADGELPPLAVGEQCRYCPSVVYCPAHTSEVVHGFLHPRNLTRLSGGFASCAADEKKAAVVLLGLAKRHLGRIEKAIKREADREPIALDGGMEYRPVRTEREVFTDDGERQIASLKAHLRAAGETEARVVWQHRVVAAAPTAPAPEPPAFGPPDEDAA